MRFMSTASHRTRGTPSRTISIPPRPRLCRSTCTGAISIPLRNAPAQRRELAKSWRRSMRFTTAHAALGVPIIHVRSVLRRGGEDDVRGISSAWRRTFPLYVGEIPNSDAHAIEGSPWTEFVTRVEPNDLIVETKRRLSAFYPTDLDFLLRNMRIESLVLNGGFTDCCILNAAFDASNHNYRVIVARDLVRGTDDQSRERRAGDGVAASRAGGGWRPTSLRVEAPRSGTEWPDGFLPDGRSSAW